VDGKSLGKTSFAISFTELFFTIAGQTGFVAEE